MLTVLFLIASPHLAVLPPLGNHMPDRAEQMVVDALAEMSQFELVTEATADRLLQVRYDASGGELTVRMELMDTDRLVLKRSQAAVMYDDSRLPRAIEDALYALIDQPPPTTSVELRSVPPGADASFDGVAVGKTPVFLPRVRPGTHRARIADNEQDVAVEAGTPVIWQVVLPQSEAAENAMDLERTRSARVYTTIALAASAALFAGISVPLFLAAGSKDGIKQNQYQTYLDAPQPDSANAAYDTVARAVNRYNTLRGIGIGLLVTAAVFAGGAAITGLTLPQINVAPVNGGVSIGVGDTF